MEKKSAMILSQLNIDNFFGGFYDKVSASCNYALGLSPFCSNIICLHYGPRSNIFQNRAILLVESNLWNQAIYTKVCVQTMEKWSDVELDQVACQILLVLTEKEIYLIWETKLQALVQYLSPKKMVH